MHTEGNISHGEYVHGAIDENDVPAYTIIDTQFCWPGMGKDHSFAELGKDYGVIYREIEKDRARFELRKKIGQFTYCFRIYRNHRNSFGLNIETEEHDFAITQMTKDELDEYFRTVHDMVSAINAEETIVSELIISPADIAYTVQEIEVCKEELRKDGVPDAELDHMYGFKILEAYEERHGKPFPVERESRDAYVARGRFFRIYFKKYFPDWEFERNPFSRIDFTLRKKSS